MTGFTGRAGFWAALAVCTSTQVSSAHAADDPETRVSELPEDPWGSWDAGSFRLAIYAGYEDLQPRQNAPAARAWSFALDPAFRLSELWWADLTFRYSLLRGDLTGIRWSVTGGAAFQPVVGLTLGLGGGYAGMRTERLVDPGEETLGPLAATSLPGGASATFNEESVCDGDGVLGYGRISYLLPFSELFATGPLAQVDVQWTRCREEEAGRLRLSRESPVVNIGFPAEIPILRRERWVHYSWTLAWVLAWR